MSSNRYYTTSILVAGILLLTPWFLLQDASAQFSEISASTRVTPERVTNIFATWDGRSPAAGVEVDLPAGWTLRDAAAVRYGSEPIAVNIRKEDASGNTYIVQFAEPLKAPHELVFQVEASGSVGEGTWTLTPFRNVAGARRTLEFETLRREVFVEPGQRARTDNRVAVFERSDGAPLLIRREAVPLLDGTRSYNLILWLRTTGLNEVVLSTWTGEEDLSYGLDVVIDAAGRLRVYRGGPGTHWVMRSSGPVADGAWRRVSLEYAPDDAWRLIIDGISVDSMSAPLQTLRVGGSPLSIGARVPSSRHQPDRAFTGMIDDVSLTSDESAADSGIRLTFETRSGGNIVQQWPERLQLARRAVAQTSDMQLHAEMRDSGVELEWQGLSDPGVTYVVERSRDGRTFITIGRLDASEGRPGGGSTTYNYIDTETPGNVLFYRVRRVGPVREVLSHTFKIGLGRLDQQQATLIGNFPNPFQNLTTISYNVHEAGRVQLSVWSVSGRRIRTIVNRDHAGGHYEVLFEGGDLPSGTYLLQMRTRSGSQSHNMILVK